MAEHVGELRPAAAQRLVVVNSAGVRVVSCYSAQACRGGAWAADGKQTRGLVEKLARVVVSISCFHA